jgi:hypothetical protein
MVSQILVHGIQNEEGCNVLSNCIFYKKNGRFDLNKYFNNAKKKCTTLQSMFIA